MDVSSTYQAPQLERFGTFRELTLQGGMGIKDIGVVFAELPVGGGGGGGNRS
jgi:hypothetical protein